MGGGGSFQADTSSSPHIKQSIGYKERKMKTVLMILGVLILALGFSIGKTYLVETADPSYSRHGAIRRSDLSSETYPESERRSFWDNFDCSPASREFGLGPLLAIAYCKHGLVNVEEA